MRETVLIIILAAVVALIVTVVLLGMRYLRADEEDDFDDDGPAEHGRFHGRAGQAVPERSRTRGRDDQPDLHGGQRSAPGRTRADRHDLDQRDSDQRRPDRVRSSRDSVGRDSAGRDSAGRDSAGRDSVRRVASGRSESARADDRRSSERRGDGGWPDAAGRDGRSSREPLPQRSRSAARSGRIDRDGSDELTSSGTRPGRGLADRDDRRASDDFDGRASQRSSASGEFDRISGRSGSHTSPSGEFDRVDGRTSQRSSASGEFDREGGRRSRAADRDVSVRRDRADGRDDLDRRERDGRAATSGRDSASREDRDRTSSTRPGTRPEPRKTGSGPADRDDSLPSIKPRQGRTKRDSDGDWPSNEWDELSDVDYWAELASDRPLPTSGPQPASGARPDRTESRKAADASLPSRAERQPTSRSGSDRDRRDSDRRDSDRLGMDRAGLDRAGLDRADIDRAASGRMSPGRTSADRQPTMADHDAPRKPASRPTRTHDLPMAPAGGRNGDSAFGGVSEDFAATGPRRTISAGNPAGDQLNGRAASVLPPLQSDDDDPLTSPSFPRIEADDSRSYRRARPGPGDGRGGVGGPADGRSRGTAPDSQVTQQYQAPPPLMPQGQPIRGLDDASLQPSRSRPMVGGSDYGAGTDYAAATVDPYRSASSSTAVPAGAGLSASGYLPQPSHGLTGPGTGSYAAAPPAAGSYPAPAVSGGYPTPPVPATGSYRIDGYSAPAQDSGSYSVPMSATAGYAYPQPSVSLPPGHPSGPIPTGPAQSGAMPPGGLPSGGAGYQSEQTVNYGGYGPSPISGPQQRPDPGYSYGSALPPAADYARGAEQAFDRQGGGRQPADDYRGYPPAPTSGPHSVPGLPMPGGFGADYSAGSIPVEPQPGYQDPQFQPYDPPGYTAPQEPAGYAGADPYAMDPYGYSGYGNGGY